MFIDYIIDTISYITHRKERYHVTMNRVIDNFILLILTGIMAFQISNLYTPVIAFLIGFLIAALGIYLSDRRQFAVVCILFLIICVFLPEATFFMPVMVYGACQYRLRWAAIGIIPFLLNHSFYQTWEIILWVTLCALAVLLSFRTDKIEQLEQDMIRTRDTGIERNLALKEKNKNLMEKQDYEIYLATLKERNRIAREIHDNVGHMLSRSILQVGALGTIHKEEPLHGQLASINDTLNQAMNSIRESVHDLHDDSIDLKLALNDATKEMQENYHVRIDYDATNNLPRNVKYCFITTVKEAMSNIVKHSNADKIDIVVREHPAFYQLSIEDNGTKIRSNLESGGIGLSNMKERVEALNGTLRIQTEQGFKIFISIRKES